MNELEDIKQIEKVAGAYCKLLNSIDWDDKLIIAGLKEGLNKFLSNAFLSLNKKNKYKQGHYYSSEALEKVEKNDFSNLVYEHMVPKNKYIQKVCEEKAKDQKLEPEFIIELLNKYWKIAVITKDEDDKLNSRSMPAGWDGENILARYEEVELKVVRRKTSDSCSLWV